MVALLRLPLHVWTQVVRKVTPKKFMTLVKLELVAVFGQLKVNLLEEENVHRYGQLRNQLVAPRKRLSQLY